MKKRIVGDDFILNIVNEIEKILSKDEKNRTIEDFKKRYSSLNWKVRRSIK